MKYNQGVLETVVRTVPVGDVVADVAYMIGAECLVAAEAGTAGETGGVFVKRGCCGLTFKAGDSPAAGGACYLNQTTHQIEGTASATNYLVGCRNTNLELGLPATRVMVDLDGTAAAVYGTPGDIEGVTASTGLAGGGTSGTVTIALSAGSIASLALADTAQPAATAATMAADGFAGELLQTVAANRAVSAAGVPVVNVVTESVAASAADQVVTSAGMSKVIKDSGIPIGNLPTMAAAGGLGNLLQTAAADRAVSDAGILVANVVANAIGDATLADLFILSAGASKAVKASTVGPAHYVTLTDWQKMTFVNVTIAATQASGSSAADPANIGADIMACSPISGNDKIPVSVSIAGDGAITVTVLAAETAEAVFRVMIYRA